MMILHIDYTGTQVRSAIKASRICYGGNSKLKIYGRLDCKSGKRLKKANRVFFSSMNEAKENGYRPCGNCMRQEYLQWKEGIATESHTASTVKNLASGINQAVCFVFICMLYF